MKKIIKIFVTFVVIIISFNFIPIKFAVRYDEHLTDEQYLCYMDIKSGELCNYKYKWVLQNNNENIWIEFNNPSPDDQLSAKSFSELYHNSWYDLDNSFVVTGEINYIVEDDIKIAIMNNEKWDIVYPIRRKSFRDKIASPKYLTVYDFDWWDLLLHLIW